MRLDFARLEPDSNNALRGVQSYVNNSGLEESLIDLVVIRVSQVNGCAFCIDMHVKDARASGETEARIYMLNAWRESELYTDRERAALAWAESVTLITNGHVPDELYERTIVHFDEHELIKLTMAVVAINSWNRMCISFRRPAGIYRSRREPRAVP